jgi:HD-GYP domain-containing protein (c-di-GMP phosphodiesterase class II)
MNHNSLGARLDAWVPPQPLTAIAVGGLALAGLAWSFLTTPTLEASPADWIATAAVVGFLAAVLVWAGTHPLHLRHQTKVYLATLPLYLMAVLAPPPVAALAAAMGVLSAQINMRPRTGNYPSDMAAAVGRWSLIVLGASTLAHLPGAAGWPLALRLGSAAALMYALDVLTVAFELSPMSGEPPRKIVIAVVRTGGLYEWAQYLVAILAGAAALYQTWTLALLVVPIYLIYTAFKNAKEVNEGTFRLLESLADTVDLRDPYTGGHSRRVADWSAAILREVNLHGAEADIIRTAARIHDIGKIGVPDNILNKPGRLTAEEKAIMDSHPVRGAELLARFSEFANGQAIVRHHHERWDGGGYPDGLRSWDIPFGARVIAVADSYDAMTSDRPYRPAMTTEKACSILRAGRDEQWDPAIVDAFLRCIETGQEEPAAQVVTVLRGEVTAEAVIGLAPPLLHPNNS